MIRQGGTLGVALGLAVSIGCCAAPDTAWTGPAAPGVERSKKSLGVAIAPVPPGAKGVLLLDRDRGLVIVNVAPGGAAERSGLKRGDVLLSIDGRPVNRESDLTDALNAASAESVAAEVSRQGKILNIVVAF